MCGAYSATTETNRALRIRGGRLAVDEHAMLILPRVSDDMKVPLLLLKRRHALQQALRYFVGTPCGAAPIAGTLKSGTISATSLLSPLATRRLPPSVHRAASAPRSERSLTFPRQERQTASHAARSLNLIEQRLPALCRNFPAALRIALRNLQSSKRTKDCVEFRLPEK